jgi:hypothetical protein
MAKSVVHHVRSEGRRTHYVQLSLATEKAVYEKEHNGCSSSDAQATNNHSSLSISSSFDVHCIPLTNGFNTPFGILWLKRAYITLTTRPPAMIPTSAATAFPSFSPEGHGSHFDASENRVKFLVHSEQNGPSCPSGHPPTRLEDPLQLAIEGQGRARSDELSLRQNPGFRLALAKVTPAWSHSNPAGHFVQQVPKVRYSVDRTILISPPGSFCVHCAFDCFAKNPIWQTHVDAPLITVVSPIPQFMHASAPPLENSLMPHTRHSEAPAFEKLPGPHSTLHIAVVMPRSVPTRPAGHRAHESGTTAPGSLPYRPRAHAWHRFTSAAPRIKLKVPRVQFLQWLLRVRPSSSKYVPAEHTVHSVPFAVSRYRPFAHSLHSDFWAAL